MNLTGKRELGCVEKIEEFSPKLKCKRVVGGTERRAFEESKIPVGYPIGPNVSQRPAQISESKCGRLGEASRIEPFIEPALG